MLVFGDVLGDSGELGSFPRAVGNGRNPGLDPADRTVGADDPELEVERLFSLFLDEGPDLGCILRVDALEPDTGIEQELLACTAEDPLEGRACVDHFLKRVERGHPEDHRARLGHGAKPLLAPAQGLDRLHALRDIPRGTPDSDRPAELVADERVPVLDDALFPGFGHDTRHALGCARVKQPMDEIRYPSLTCGEGGPGW